MRANSFLETGDSAVEIVVVSFLISLKSMLNINFDRVEINLGVVVLAYVPGRVHHELAEVPGDVADDAVALVEEGAVEPAVLEGVLRGGSVHVRFVEHGELHAVGLLGPGVDRRVGAGFLVGELVAGEGEDFESLRVVLVPHLDHPFIGPVGGASVSRNVDDKGRL